MKTVFQKILVFLAVPLFAFAGGGEPTGVARQTDHSSNSPAVATNGDVGSAEWVDRALASGDLQAVVTMGSNFLTGNGVLRNERWAVTLFVGAAIMGDSDAKRFMGFIFLQGTGEPQDTARAIDWLESAARTGNPRAQANLGEVYYSISPPDLSNAVRWISKSADQGYAPAQYDLGTAYENGVGVKPDNAKALMWLQLAANGGNKDASNELRVLNIFSAPAEREEAQRQVKVFKPAASNTFVPDDGKPVTCALAKNFVIPVKMFAEAKHLLVDTGSPLTLLDSSYVARLGEGLLDMKSPHLNATIFAGPDFFIGERRLVPLLVCTTSIRKIDEKPGPDIDGILGLDCLTNFVISFDSTKGEFSIGSSVSESTKKIAEALPLEHLATGGFTIDVFANEHGPIKARIDSGYSGSLTLDDSNWQKAYPTGVSNYESGTSLVLGTNMDVIFKTNRSAHLQLLTVGTNRYSNLIADHSSPGMVSALGQEFIRKHLFTIDFPNRRLYLLPASTAK